VIGAAAAAAAAAPNPSSFLKHRTTRQAVRQSGSRTIGLDDFSRTGATLDAKPAMTTTSNPLPPICGCFF